jgi:oxygen-independent coproporphyrinogen III oxidase
MFMKPTITLRDQSPYQQYVYGYPHKTAYRTFPEPRSLQTIWAQEPKDALFLYVHVPFCEMRCGFCNLFTEAKPKEELVTRYLQSQLRQFTQVSQALGTHRMARFAMGGGTPTQLTTAQLSGLFSELTRSFHVDFKVIPTSVESSPETLTLEKAQLLRGVGVDRLSIGIQSFVPQETQAIKRPQNPKQVQATLDLARNSGFPTLNLDLIYGLPEQTTESWLVSLQTALTWKPEELYLYPLYVRPLTSLGRSSRSWDDHRLQLYRTARDFLLSHGYTQSSMRMFVAPHAPGHEGPVYCVQDDGMVGLGCGARSYTRPLHYGNSYAVGRPAVHGILEHWTQQSDQDFSHTFVGFALDEQEQKRRYILLTLLAEGLPLSEYQQRFSSQALEDFSELRMLLAENLAEIHNNHLQLTPDGLERSDSIGPWLFSEQVHSTMNEYQPT